MRCTAPCHRVDDRIAVLLAVATIPPGSADAVLATIDAGRSHGDLVVVDLPRADTAVVRGVVDPVDVSSSW